MAWVSVVNPYFCAARNLKVQVFSYNSTTKLETFNTQVLSPLGAFFAASYGVSVNAVDSGFETVSYGLLNEDMYLNVKAKDQSTDVSDLTLRTIFNPMLTF